MHQWVGQIGASDTPLVSPWNTQLYRLSGPSYPAEGILIIRQVLKSAFELAWDAQLAAGQTYLLQGRSWSGNGRIRRVEVSTDAGQTWCHTTPLGRGLTGAWQRWQIPWRPGQPGSYTLRARATDVTGATQLTRSYTTGSDTCSAASSDTPSQFRHPVIVT